MIIFFSDFLTCVCFCESHHLYSHNQYEFLRLSNIYVVSLTCMMGQIRSNKIYLHTNQLRRFALRFFHSHSGATGVFCLICRTVYFRCAANLISASSKISVRRLKVGDLLIKILVHCALLCLAFLVPGRS